jgi:CubicO group peptidase (beta-lactamase class C family)
MALGATIGAALLSVSSQATSNASLSASALSSIADIANQEIANGHVPGAVVLIGQGHEIVYRQAFGARSMHPEFVPMTVDTIFDLASLTKVVATTTAVMQLVELGQLDLDASASKYWPAFGTAGKQAITIRDLLTHYSGLKADLNLRQSWSGYGTAMRLLVAERPLNGTRTQYLYSDENFEVLGEIVRRVTGMTLDRYCDEHIFKPLGMLDTRFRPPPGQATRIAATSSSRANGHTRVVVNDPTAQRMGGIAGHAGLFSTAADLATFATMLLDGGTVHDAQVLSRASVALMTQPASPPAGSHQRGLGWDLAEPLVSAGAEELSAFSYGHTGFTGTMLWIDPVSRSYVIVLSNRTYHSGHGDAQPLRKAILTRISTALSAVTASAVLPQSQ